MSRSCLALLVYWIFLFAFVSKVMSGGSLKESDEFIFGGVAWSPDGEILAVGTNKGINLHWASDLIIQEHLSEVSFVQALDWSPTSNALISGSGSGEVILWQKDIRWVGELLGKYEELVNWVGISPDGQLAASSGIGAVRVYSLQQDRKTRSINLDSNYSYWVSAVQWNINSNQLIIAMLDMQHMASFYGLTTSQIEHSLNDQFIALSFKLSPDGSRLAVIVDGTPPVQLWDVSTGKALTTYSTNDAYVNALAWSPDSTLLAIQISGERDVKTGAIYIWDVTSNTLVATLDNVIMTGDGNYNNAIAWSPSGDRIASISDDGRVIIWDGETFDTLVIYNDYKSIVLDD